VGNSAKWQNWKFSKTGKRKFNKSGNSTIQQKWKFNKSGNSTKVEIQQKWKFNKKGKTGNSTNQDLSQKQQNGNPMKLHCQEFRCPGIQENNGVSFWHSPPRQSTNLEWPLLYTHSFMLITMVQVPPPYLIPSPRYLAKYMAQAGISLTLGWNPRIFSVDSISLSALPNTSQMLLLLSHWAHSRGAAHKLHINGV